MTWKATPSGKLETLLHGMRAQVQVEPDGRVLAYLEDPIRDIELYRYGMPTLSGAMMWLEQVADSL